MPCTRGNLNKQHHNTSMIYEFKSVRNCYVLCMCKTVIHKIHFSAEHKYFLHVLSDSD